MKRDDDKIKWLIACSKNQSINIEWTHENFSNYYEDIEPTKDDSATKLIQLEQKRENGIGLDECLDLFVKEDTVDDFQCDNCDEKSESKIQVQITRLPEILIIHLKRFDFIAGQLK